MLDWAAFFISNALIFGMKLSGLSYKKGAAHRTIGSIQIYRAYQGAAHRNLDKYDGALHLWKRFAINFLPILRCAAPLSFYRKTLMKLFKKLFELIFLVSMTWF
jgi:hypothetical protein